MAQITCNRKYINSRVNGLAELVHVLMGADGGCPNGRSFAAFFASPPTRVAKGRGPKTGVEGHENIMHTVRYTELSPERFKNFWDD